MPCELVRRHIPSCSSKFDVKIENLEIIDVGNYNISETITTTETWVAPFVIVTLPSWPHGKNDPGIFRYHIKAIRPEARALNEIFLYSFYYWPCEFIPTRIDSTRSYRSAFRSSDVDDFIFQKRYERQKRRLHRLVARQLPLARVETELEYLLPFRRYLTGTTAQNADISLFFFPIVISRANSFERVLISLARTCQHSEVLMLTTSYVRYDMIDCK